MSGGANSPYDNMDYWDEKFTKAKRNNTIMKLLGLQGPLQIDNYGDQNIENIKRMG